MRWLAFLLILVALFVAGPGHGHAQSQPGAPAITRVTADTNSLTVSWREPTDTGGSPVTAYHLHYVRSDAPDKAPANWTLEANIWQEGDGSLRYEVEGLLDGTSYDVSVHATTANGDGDWSPPRTGTTRDHRNVGGSSATLLAPDSSVRGRINPADDHDYFRFTLTQDVELWLYTTGDLDTAGALANSRGMVIAFNDDGELHHGQRNFSIQHALTPGTYYLRVTSFDESSTGAYTLHSRTVTLPGSTIDTAATVTPGSVTPGRVGPTGGPQGDVDYYKLVLASVTDIWVMAVGGVDTTGSLVDTADNELATNSDSHLLGNEAGFMFRQQLQPGTYYITVRGAAAADTGPYTLHVRTATEPGSTSATAAPLKLGTPETGRIGSAGDVDYYTLTLTAETTYLNLYALSFGGALALTPTIVDDQGTDVSMFVIPHAQWAEDDAPEMSAWAWGSLEAGTYEIRMGGSAGATGSYLIHPRRDKEYGYFNSLCTGLTAYYDDPLHRCQWHLKNTGQLGGGAMGDIGVEEVWAGGNLGAGVNVALVDDGLQYTHEDLAPNVVTSRNHDFTGEDDVYHPLRTHGTAVAGIIAARDNTVGVRGVAPRASIYAYNLRAETTISTQNLAAAMTRDLNVTDISNNSWGLQHDGSPRRPSASWEAAVARGVTAGNGGDGIFYVKSGGNQHALGSESNLDGTSNFYALTTVCAIGYDDKRSAFSELGVNLWICAPGSNTTYGLPTILTTTNGSRYDFRFSGTSAATPMVSGVAALVRAANTTLTWRDVKLILANSARRNDSSNGGWQQGASKYGPSSGRYFFNREYGFGAVDAAAAVSLAANWPPLPPMREVEAESGALALAIPDAPTNGSPSVVTATLDLEPGVEFIEFIEVEVEMQHESFRDLKIEIVAPSGRVSVLAVSAGPPTLKVYPAALDGDHRFGSARHLGEDAAGIWTLRISDVRPTLGGTLTSWKLKAYGHGQRPGLSTLTAGETLGGALNVSWSLPDYPGSSPVTSYDLRYILANAADQSDGRWAIVSAVGTPEDRPHVVTGLPASTEYLVAVAAVNKAGRGAWSDAIMQTTGLLEPDAPLSVTVAPRDGALAVSWIEPVYIGAPPLIAYDIRYIESSAPDKSDARWTPRMNAWTAASGDLRAVVRGLENGTPYDVQVRARNNRAHSAWSSTVMGEPEFLNSAPRFPGSEAGARSLLENAPVGSGVGAPIAARDDEGDTLTYTLSAGSNSFEINSTTGRLRTTAALDHEDLPTHDLTVVVSDGKDRDGEAVQAADDIDDTIAVTVTVTDFDEPPDVNGDTAPAIDENGSRYVGAYTATDPEEETTSWERLTGLDAGHFVFDETTGELSFDPRFMGVPDYEARPRGNTYDNTYEVTLRASDGTQNVIGTLDVVVTVNNVDEPPVVTGPASVTDYPESGRPMVAAYTAKDPEDDRVTWSLQGDDAAHLRISARGVLTFPSPNHEIPVDRNGDNTYEVTVVATAAGKMALFPVAVTVMNVDEPPDVRDEAGEANVTIEENSAPLVGRYIATDPEGETTSWEGLTGSDAGHFVFDETTGVLRFKEVPDFEARPRDNTYEVTVRASDGTQNVLGTLDVVVTVTNVNEPPVIIGPASVTDFPENSSPSRRVGRYSASDPEGGGVTWSDLSGGDATAFTLSNDGVLTFRSSPNYEDKSQYEVRLNAFDGLHTGSLDVTVAIGNVDEPPDVMGEANVTVEENSAALVGAYTVTDPEGETTSWVSLDGSDARFFVFDEIMGELSFMGVPDYEARRDNTYEVRVRASDGTQNVLGTLAVVVTVTDVNEPPVITPPRAITVPGSLDYAESGTGAIVFTAMDPEEGTVVWQAIEGADGDDFTFSNGTLRFRATPDYEDARDAGADNIYNVTIRASDGEEISTYTLAIRVTNVDEMTPMTLSSEQPQVDTALTATLEDPDGVNTTEWKWERSTSRSGGWTEIVGQTAGSYTPMDGDVGFYLRVTASYTDGHGPNKSLSAISRNKVQAAADNNEEPQFAGATTTRSVCEDASARATVGAAVVATDADGDRLAYTLTGSDLFTIDGTTGQIRVASSATLNHETAPSQDVTVTATDPSGEDASITVTIEVEDVNERPEAVDDRASTEEDEAVVIDVLANDSDPDDGDTLTVTLRGQPRDGLATVSNVTSEITYTPDENYNGADVFTYRATDQGGLSSDGTVSVTINAVNDAPEFGQARAERSISEAARTGDDVGEEVAATDVDHPRLTYSLSGAPDFEIDPATGQITVRSPLNREVTESYSAIVTAVDGQGADDSIDVTINVTDVNERPAAENDSATTDEDMAVNINVLANDSDPETANVDLRVTVRATPRNGRARVEADQTITYTPNDDFDESDVFTYTLSDGRLSHDATVTVEINPLNDPPTFPAATAARTVSEEAVADDAVGAPVVASDVDNAILTYRLSAGDTSLFGIEREVGQIMVGPRTTFDVANLDTYSVTVEADDGSGGTASVEVTITVTAGSPPSRGTVPIGFPIGSGGGGGGGPSGPTPSQADFEWTVKHDINELAAGHDRATGMSSDGATLWLAHNGDGADDAVYAYDLESGERVEDREFELDERNRAPRGVWSDRETMWVSDSGQDTLFAYDLAGGERLEDHDIVLHEDNSDARGIWSGDGIMWVLDSRADALFAYDLGSGDLLGEYALHSANGDPHGLWSDGVTIWVSDHGEKDLLAYRLPMIEAEGAPVEADLERVRDEDFTELSKASNNSPRGIWSDGDVMYVADESDVKVYTYNMPDAIDARLASLTLDGIDIGEFDRNRIDYEATPGAGATETTVAAEAMQRRTDVVVDPPDADGDDTNGHQVALQDISEVTVTVTSADGSRKKVYRVALGGAAEEPWPHCLLGDVATGFSLVVYEGGSVEELVACAQSRSLVALYALHDGAYVSYIVEAPAFVNRSFVELFGDGLPAFTPLVAGSGGPPSADPASGGGVAQSWPECLHGEVVEGFSLVLYEGGSVEDLEACAGGMGVTALYALHDGAYVSYILGAPAFVNRAFSELFAEGVPAVTPLVARSDRPPTAN